MNNAGKHPYSDDDAQYNNIRRDLKNLPKISAPPGFNDELFAKLGIEPPAGKKKPRIFNLFTTRVFITSAAASILVIIGALLMWRHTPDEILSDSPQPAASSSKQEYSQPKDAGKTIQKDDAKSSGGLENAIKEGYRDAEQAVKNNSVFKQKSESAAGSKTASPEAADRSYEFKNRSTTTASAPPDLGTPRGQAAGNPGELQTTASERPSAVEKSTDAKQGSDNAAKSYHFPKAKKAPFSDSTARKKADSLRNILMKGGKNN